MSIIRSQLKILLWLLFLPGLFAGCSKQQPGLEPLAADAVILAFGDSLTFGTGASNGASYPAQLQQLSGHTVINAGIPGELSDEGLQRLPGVLAQTTPDLLVLVHGGNDLLRKKPRSRLRDNLLAMIELARAQDVQVVMMAVPIPGLLLNPAAIYAEVAETANVPVDMDTLAEILQYSDNKSDGIHPNDSGYQKMARSLYNLLIETGALQE